MATLSRVVCRSFSARRLVSSSMRSRKAAKAPVICAISAFDAVVSALNASIRLAALWFCACAIANCPSASCSAPNRFSRLFRAAARAASVSACFAVRFAIWLFRAAMAVCTLANWACSSSRLALLAFNWLVICARLVARSALARRSIFNSSPSEANCWRISPSVASWPETRYAKFT